MAEIREVMLLMLTHYGHSYLMHKISNNVLIIFKQCYFVYSSLLLQNMPLLLMYNLYSCTTISLIVIPSENLEVVLLFTACQSITFEASDCSRSLPLALNHILASELSLAPIREIAR